MDMDRLETAIRNREIVRIGDRAGHAVGMRGMAMGYNASYHSVKVGFVDENGNYTGEFTTVGFNHVEIEETSTETPAENHWGCQSNEERSPFSTSRKTCRGPVTANRVSYGLKTSWKCSKHWAEID